MSIGERGITLSFHTSPPFDRPFANTKPFPKKEIGIKEIRKPPFGLEVSVI
jgi:hypothetical protein